MNFTIAIALASWLHPPIDDNPTYLSGAKVRPALFISNAIYLTAFHDAVVLALTSNLSKSDDKVFIESQDLETGSLPVKVLH